MIHTTEAPADLSRAARGLLEKYGHAAAAGGAWRVAASLPQTPDDAATLLVPGHAAGDAQPGPRLVPLLPWRCQRRFVELRRLIEQQTVAPLLMGRFHCSTDGRTMGLAAILYRELDLAEWIAGSAVVSVMASIEDDRWANVVVRLGSGVVCGLELACTLPAGTPPIDRHELIARRGVACDRVVDTQVPQSSVYTFTADGPRQYTDVDSELFGLPLDQVDLVRAACEALVDPGRVEALRRQHRRLSALVRLAYQSSNRRQRLTAEGDLA